METKLRYYSGPVSYRVKLTNGKDRRHEGQVCKRSVKVPQDSHIESDSLDIPDIDLPSEVTARSIDNCTASSASETTSTESNSMNTQSALPNPVCTQNTDAAVVNPTPNTVRLYPKRNRAPVVTFESTWTYVLLSPGCITSLLIQLYNFYFF